ncbi:oral-facial-digital syndrome 1 protein homolog isoform X2 [Megalops cyprinoides]|uniref:oral-facial-digital syndrome 1 protein homolog isoform X2 n=1 Tax=Megalops cyprinoides TaxID=118141 RepID=UPI0018649B06|nr:oral-facial-digital syndrome 1 protein homolog isoform X2 [Megalops cyprinoides]
MSDVKEEVISSEEMRKRLYKTFKNRGLLDTLKTQLRNHLIQELKHPAVSGEPVARTLTPEADSMLVTASNSLVLDHLHRAGYEYTLSVFYPECGLERGKEFSTRDLLQLMKISPQSTLYKSLTSGIGKDKQRGFLMKLLIELMDHHIHRNCCDADTQTSSTLPHRESLLEKMQMIDDEYAALQQRAPRWESLEAKLAEYRKEIEAQSQAEVKAKLKHFKDMEVAKMKMEEKETFRKEIVKLRHNMERTYQLKSKALINREKNAIERLQKQQEIDEKEVYMQRQLLLKEVDCLWSKEAELRQRTEDFEKACRRQEEKIRSTEELLGHRELAARNLEDMYDQKLKNELTRYQLELKQEYLQRTQKVTEDEKRNEMEAVRLQKEAACIEAKAEEYRRTCTELQRLQMVLDNALSQTTLLTQQNKLLKEQLEAMSDYPMLKRERVELQAQLRLIKRQLEEVQEENHHLQTDLSKPSQEQLALQAKLWRVEGARKLEEEEFENQKQILQVQLQHEVERCAQLKDQLMECEERTQRMASHAEDLKLQLRQTQLALENEVLRCSKPYLVDRFVLDLADDKIVPPDIYIDGPVQRNLYDLGPEPHRHQHQWACSGSPNCNTELVAGTKARIQELEKEAESLEEAYRNYQQRALHAVVSSLQPANARSPQQKRLPGHPMGPTDPHTRVTFAQDNPPPLLSALISSQLFESQDPGMRTPPERSSGPPRRLSSTPLSISKRQIRRDTAEDTQVSPVTFHDLSPERQLSPIPHSRASLHRSLTGCPILKSIAQEPIGSENEQKDHLSSTGSSPHPEKITLDDLTEPPPDLGYILQTGQNQAKLVHEVPQHGLMITPPESPSVQLQVLKCGTVSTEAHQSPMEAGRGGEEDKEEELQWEEERKRREEKRKQDRQEALEREQRELERVSIHSALLLYCSSTVKRGQQEFIHVLMCNNLPPKLLKEEEQQQELREECQEEEEDIGGEVFCDKEVQESVEGQDIPSNTSPLQKGQEQNTLSHGDPAQKGQQQDTLSNADPLQKYMRIVMEGKQSPKDDMEGRSLEFEILSDEKDNSIASFSQNNADEDFW